MCLLVVVVVVVVVVVQQRRIFPVILVFHVSNLFALASHNEGVRPHENGVALTVAGGGGE